MNKQLILLITLCFLSYSNVAQETAITISGDTVYLFDNGMWSYENEEPTPIETSESDAFKHYEIQDSTNQIYTNPSTNKKSIDKKKEAFVLTYDKSIWKRVPVANINEAANYTFMSKAEDMFAMIIYEEVEVGLDNIVDIAMQTIKNNLKQEAEILASDYVIVNGKKMIHLTYGVESSGINLIFDSFYYSGLEGTSQYSAWTYRNVHSKKQKEILKLLAGLTIR